jgi:hypothetical protein
MSTPEVELTSCHQAGGNPNGFAEMTSCTDGTYCWYVPAPSPIPYPVPLSILTLIFSGRNNLTCCGTAWAIEPPTVVSSALTATVTASAASSPSNTKTLAGLGAALGAVLLLAVGSVLYLLRRIRKLKSSLADSQPLLDRHSAELHALRGIGMGIGKSPLGSPSPSGRGTPKHMLAASPIPSPAMLPASSHGMNMSPGMGMGMNLQEAESERLKGLYPQDSVVQQSQRRGSPPMGGGLDYLFRASELDGAGVQQRGMGMDARGNRVYEIPGQGRQAWNTSPRLMGQQRGTGR